VPVMPAPDEHRMPGRVTQPLPPGQVRAHPAGLAQDAPAPPVPPQLNDRGESPARMQPQMRPQVHGADAVRWQMTLRPPRPPGEQQEQQQQQDENQQGLDAGHNFGPPFWAALTALPRAPRAAAVSRPTSGASSLETGETRSRGNWASGPYRSVTSA